MRAVFVDCETTRLQPLHGVITTWEIALIVDGVEYCWQIWPDLDWWADDTALKVGGFWERISLTLARDREAGAAMMCEHPKDIDPCMTVGEVAEEIHTLTDGADMWGSNPAFDMGHLRTLLDAYGPDEPAWHYHPNDVPTAARGWCAAKGIRPVSARGDGRIRSDDWSRAIGVDPDLFGRHTALGDARWCRAQYLAMGLGV